MAFRVSDSNIFESALRYIRRNRIALDRLQDQVGSGKRLSSVGDEPGTASRVLGLRDNLLRLEQYERNINSARAELQNTESVVDSVGNLMIRVRELAVSADVERGEFDLIRSEIDQRFDELLALANTRLGDRFLFAGFATDTQPVTQTGTFADPAPIVTYAGDSGVIASAIDSGAQLETNVTARELFFGSTDGDDTADGSFVNLFSVLQDLHNRLLDPVANGEPTDVLGDIDRGLRQINQVRSRIGGRTNRLDSAHEQLASLRITLEGERASLEDTDIVSAITDLKSREATLQATLSVTGRVLQPSLLDFLR
jgi:flagellar hook-associated protein 3 FlgL